MKNEDRKPVNGCLKKGRKYLNISLIWNYDHHIFCIPTASHAHFCMKTVK